MAESVARRDRIDSQTLTSWYLWEAPQQPACVYVAFDVIDRLEHEVVENFRSLTSRGSEVGGILLGGVVSGTPAGIYVADYEAISCDYSRGPLYRLSETDLSRFERAVEQHSAGSVQVVGFFRSHTRKGLVLDAEDLAFLDARFRNPHSLALVVRPFATKASVAGIFLRGENGFNGDVSVLEFPFRSAQLTPSKKGPESSQAPPPVRAQVVPIATRREASAVQPPPVAGAAPTAVSQPTAPPPEAKPAGPAPISPVTVPAPPKAEAKTPAAPVSEPGASPASSKSTVTSPKEAAPPKEKEVPAPKPQASPRAQVAATAPIEAKPAPKLPETLADAVNGDAKRPSKVPMLTGILAAALLAFVLLFVYPGFLHHSSHSSSGVTQDSSPLTLRVEHTGTDLLLTWNRDSAAIQNASHATLAITDGDRHENYDMDLAQLRTGSIVYSPLGADVSFRMEVVGKDQSRTTTETLRMLRTPRPSPMPAEGQDVKGSKITGPMPAQSTASTAQVASSPSEAAATSDSVDGAPAKPANQPKPFDTSSLSQRLRPVRTADLSDIPSPAAGGPVAPKVNTGGALPFASLPAAPAPSAPPAATPAPPRPSTPAPVRATENLSAGGQIQPAQLISRKEPEYPLLARQMGAKGTVELIATIGTDGTVKAVKVVKGHPLLVNAAKDAVMQWRYRPTLLNGQPVQNDTRITLNFMQ
jgi:TonB family protein